MSDLRQDLIRSEGERAATLFNAIAHGDDEHRAWLKEAIDAHFAGEPVPEPRGKGRKEAIIRELVEALDKIAKGSNLGKEMFEQRVRDRKDRLTWFAVNVLQDNLAACEGTAETALAKVRAASNSAGGRG